MSIKPEQVKAAKQAHEESTAEATARVAGGDELVMSVTKLEQKNAAALKALNLPATFPARGGVYHRQGDKLTQLEGPDKNGKDAA